MSLEALIVLLNEKTNDLLAAMASTDPGRSARMRALIPECERLLAAVKKAGGAA